MYIQCLVCSYISVCVEYLLTATRNASIGDAEVMRRDLPVQEVECVHRRCRGDEALPSRAGGGMRPSEMQRR